MKLERWGRNALARILGFFSTVQKKDPSEIQADFQAGRIRKILLIRPHQGLGDLLLATPMFRALKQAQPQVELHFLASDYNPIAVRHNPHVSRIWIWDKKAMRNPIRLWRFFRDLRAQHFDLSLIIFSHVPSFTSFLLGRLSGARLLWSYTTDAFYGGANWSRYLADVELPSPPDEGPECAKFMGLVRPLGADSHYEPEFTIRPETRQWADERWETYRWEFSGPVIGLFLAGNPDRPERLWPVSAWVQLTRQLMKEKQLRLIAIVPPENLISGSGAAEPGIYETFSKELGVRLPCFSAPDLEQVAAFLQHVNLFVCPDGGVFHIAAAAHVSTLGLFFASDPLRWAPPVPWVYRVSDLAVPAAQLSPESVYRRIQEILSH